MINLFFLLILSILFWGFSALISKSPLKAEILNLLKEIIVIFINFIKKLIELALLLVRDFLNSLQIYNTTINKNEYKEDSNNSVTETDYPYRISKICKDLS